MPTSSNPKPVRDAASLSYCIGFRLTAEHYIQLAERANRLGVSVHQLAKAYVCQVFDENQERAELETTNRMMHVALTRLSGNIAFATKAMLMAVGQSEEEAAQYIRDNFNK